VEQLGKPAGRSRRDAPSTRPPADQDHHISRSTDRGLGRACATTPNYAATVLVKSITLAAHRVPVDDLIVPGTVSPPATEASTCRGIGRARAERPDCSSWAVAAGVQQHVRRRGESDLIGGASLPSGGGDRRDVRALDQPYGGRRLLARTQQRLAGLGH